MEAARHRLEQILKDAEASGLSKDDVVRLGRGWRRETERNRKRRRDQKEAGWTTGCCSWLWQLTGLSLTAVLVIRWQLYSLQGLAAAWAAYQGLHPTAHRCAIWMPDSLYQAFRPPVDCGICRDVHQIDRVKNISPQDFEAKYAFSGRPVIITDAMTNWTAPSVFSFEFFRRLYSGSTTQDKCQFFPYKTEFRSLWEVFDMPQDRANLLDGSDPWYVGWSNCDEEVGEVLRGHYSRPYFLPEDSESKQTDWIFMGSPGYGAHLHVDNVKNPSWQAQLLGAKNWTLQPPPECLYECPSHLVTIHQGEIIVLDTNQWYHSTLIVSEGISITIGAEYD